MDDTVIRYDPAAYERAYTRLKRAPLELDAADFAQLEIINPDFVTQAWEGRRRAQLAIVRQHQVAPLETKAAPAAAHEQLTWDEHIAKHGHRPLRLKDLGVVVDELFAVLKTHKAKISDGLTQSQDRFEALEARLAALEKKPIVKFCGPFERGKAYLAGDACVHKSALWICRVPTSGAPGEDCRLAIGAQTRGRAMTEHIVDPNARGIDSDDLACWLLFFLESHGADVILHTDTSVQVNLDPMPGLDAVTVGRWAPIIAILLPRVSRDSARSPCSGAGRGGPVSLKQAGPTYAHMPDTDTSARPVFRLMVRRLVSRTMGIVSAARRRPCDGRPAFGRRSRSCRRSVFDRGQGSSIGAVCSSTDDAVHAMRKNAQKSRCSCGGV